MFIVENCVFLNVVRIPYPKNRFLVILRSFFSTYKLFPGRWGWCFPVSIIKKTFFNKTMSSVAGLKKIIHISAKAPILANFDYLGPPSKSIFSTYRHSFKKSSSIYLEEVVRNIVLDFELSIFKEVRKGRR